MEEAAGEGYPLETLLKQALMGEIKLHRKRKFPEMCWSLPGDTVQSQRAQSPQQTQWMRRVGANLSVGAVSMP